MALAKITSEELRKARAAGFKRKKPKKPKKKTLATYENYVRSYNAWVKDAKEKAKHKKAKISDKAKARKLWDNLKH